MDKELESLSTCSVAGRLFRERFEGGATVDCSSLIGEFFQNPDSGESEDGANSHYSSVDPQHHHFDHFAPSTQAHPRQPPRTLTVVRFRLLRLLAQSAPSGLCLTYPKVTSNPDHNAVGLPTTFKPLLTLLLGHFTRRGCQVLLKVKAAS